MNENDFWSSLEYRVSRGMLGIEECRKAGLWCDGFIPEEYELDSNSPVIRGRAWIGRGPRDQEQWTLAVLLSATAEGRDQVPWTSLLLPADVTGWLSVRWNEKHLEIEPAVAVPDEGADR